MKGTLTIGIEPEITVEDGRVWCEGREVGEFTAGEWDQRDSTYHIHMRIDDEAVRRAIIASFADELKNALREFRDAPAGG